MTIKMATDSVNQNAVMTTRKTIPAGPSMSNARSSVMLNNTSDSCACASERAQRRRYEAVLEIHPRQNSIVSEGGSNERHR